jgi:LCP family protein required for cell wall assembly
VVQQPHRQSRRSPFAAAVLSLLFPGLGQLYARRPARALAWAAPAILALALGAGLLVGHDARQALVADLFAPATLQLILILDVLVFGYRAAAIIDAFRVASARPDAAAAGWSTRPSRMGTETGRRARPSHAALPGLRAASVAGLAAALLVLGIGHVALARYDRIAYDTITGITDTSSGPDSGAASGAPSAAASPSGTASGSAGPSAAAPSPSTVPWNGKGRLNVLLIGSDQRAPSTSFNTDTMIVASIDPTTGQVAMFSIPRDTENVPLAPGSAAAAAFSGGVYPNRINSLWAYATNNPGLFPGSTSTRGAAALKGALGTMLGLDIKYYVMVDFAGFTTVVDTLGGAMIDVQLPVQDYAFPASDGAAIKLFIPPGIQYMTGTQALQYARARHQTNDFDRSQRQQRVIASIRAQTNLLSLLDPNRLGELSTALRSAIHTDYPAANLPALITLLQKVDLANLRSYVFTPPVYETQCTPAQCAVHYFLHPRIAAIQRAVRQAFSVDPALAASRLTLAGEGATVWVLGGSKSATQAGSVSDYLDYLGVGALVPPNDGGRAPSSTYTDTVITAYNGAETTMPETVRVLEATFGVTVVTAEDPSVTADFVVITGSGTPDFKVPNG